MRINTFFYSIRQGLKNIFRNKMFSLASVATMAACIFMFGLFYIIVTNFSATVHSIEEGVSVTVFFENDATDAQIRDIGEKINKRAEVSKNEYVSADEAWKEYKKVYFQGKEELADGFTERCFDAGFPCNLYQGTYRGARGKRVCPGGKYTDGF